MTLLVQKYGGSSLADSSKISQIADKIATFARQQHDLVVVVSAMYGATDSLFELAASVTKRPANLREMDMLLATGEQVSMSLLSMALLDRGIKACSYNAAQIKIVTDKAHGNATIESIDTNLLKQKLAMGFVVIVAGFQGVTADGEITTIGRGGSDLTAVALAQALAAKECQIYTDVAGVYTADPRIVANARLLSHITFAEMLELSSLGAKVLHKRAVELAGKHKVPLRVLSSFVEGRGTLISYEGATMKDTKVSGISACRDDARVLVCGLPDTPGVAGRLLSPISEAHISVDMILQNVAENDLIDFTFTVPRQDLNRALLIIKPVAEQMDAKKVVTDNRVAKLSLVGAGMHCNFGIASKMFTELGDAGINIQSISTSEIKVSVLIDEKYIELGVRILHEVFMLGEKQKQLTFNM